MIGFGMTPLQLFTTKGKRFGRFAEPLVWRSSVLPSKSVATPGGLSPGTGPGGSFRHVEPTLEESPARTKAEGSVRARLQNYLCAVGCNSSDSSARGTGIS